jgi:hypothetical protein
MSRFILGRLSFRALPRCISSDSGTPDRFDQTFRQRDNPLLPLQ